MTGTLTKIVKGRYYDGVTSAKSGYVAKKINDAIGASTVKSVTTFLQGNELVAVIVLEA
jgi:hypothetical protein